MNIRIQIDSLVVPGRAIYAWKPDRLRAEVIQCVRWFGGEILGLAFATHHYGVGFTASASRDMVDPYDRIVLAAVAGAKLRTGVA